MLLIEAILLLAANSALVPFAKTTGGAMGDAIAYAWLMLYVAWVFPAFWAPSRPPGRRPARRRAGAAPAGHAAGDRLLSETTAAWRDDQDVLARIGGDEFVLVMPGTSPAQADAVLERLRQVHPAPWSAGVGRWRPDEPLDACLQRADERLYAAKSSRG